MCLDVVAPAEDTLTVDSFGPTFTYEKVRNCDEPTLIDGIVMDEALTPGAAVTVV